MQIRTIAAFTGPASSRFELAGRRLTLMGHPPLGQMAGGLDEAPCAT